MHTGKERIRVCRKGRLEKRAGMEKEKKGRKELGGIGNGKASI